MGGPPAGLVVSLPYQERAALAIIQAAAQRTDLTVLAGAGLPTKYFDMPGVSLHEIGRMAMLARRGFNIIPSPLLRLRAMHAAKYDFDRIAAHHVGSTESILAFPGAALRSFRATDGTKTLHAVDAHPRAHNERLVDVYGAKLARSELYPTWLVNVIEAELEMADLVLTPSALVSEQMTRHGLSTRKVVSIPYGSDFSTFQPVGKRGEPRPRPKVIYVGQITRRKGIPFLLQAMQGLALDCTLVGTNFEPSLLRNAPPNCRHIDSVSHEELAQIYATHDALVLPSIEDACSLVAMEAAASGLPVITTDQNGAIEILPEDVLRSVQVASVLELRRTLMEVEPLTHEERQANRRLVISSNTVVDWSVYGSAVLDAIS